MRSVRDQCAAKYNQHNFGVSEKCRGSSPTLAVIAVESTPYVQEKHECRFDDACKDRLRM